VPLFIKGERKSPDVRAGATPPEPQPNIVLEFDENDERCKNLEESGIFVHLLAFNRGSAPVECEAILTAVTRNGASVGYKSPKNLSWAEPRDGAPEKYSKIRLYNRPEPYLIDILHAGTLNGRAGFILRNSDYPRRPWYSEIGDYRLEIRVLGLGVNSNRTLIVEWRSDPRKVRVRTE
jgi:hypothetical protein